MVRRANPTRQNHATPVALFLVLTIAVLTGCESQPTEVQDYQTQAVLAAYLACGEPVSQIYLQWVAPLQGYYELNNLGIPGCDMILFPLDDPLSQDTLRLMQHPDPDSTWIYLPASGEAPLIPGSRVHYRLEVKNPSEGLDLWSETVIPDSFYLWINGVRWDSLQTDTMTREDPNLMLSWNTPDSGGGYAFFTRALTSLDSIVTLDPGETPGVDSLDTANVSLVSYWMCRYDQVFQPMPWMLFNWAGPTTVEMQAGAPAYNDYITSLARASQGFPIQYDSNIHGGLGIFGGLSRRKFEVVMARVE